MYTKLSALALTATLAACAPGMAQSDPTSGRGAGRMLQEMDANRDGRITQQEMQARVAQRFAEADANRDNALTMDEFRNAMPRRRADAPAPTDGRFARMLEMRFRMTDQNGDGRVTLDEAQATASAFFRGMDANGDGAVSQDELPRRGRGMHHGPRDQAPAAPG